MFARASARITKMPGTDVLLAGHNLYQLFLKLYCAQKLAAADLCQLCHWCALANVKDADFTQCGLPPGLQSGKYQRLLDTVLPASGHSTTITVPQSRKKHRIDRSTVEVTCSMVQESLADDKEMP